MVHAHLQRLLGGGVAGVVAKRRHRAAMPMGSPQGMKGVAV
jgi:hypothetical protein